MNKIAFPNDDRSMQMFHGEGLIEADYEITSVDFSPLLGLDYQKRWEVHDRRTYNRFQVRYRSFC